MKKIILAFVCFFILSQYSQLQADEPVMDVKEAAIHTILGGVIKSVSWADPNKGTKSEIVVMNPSRKPVNIYVVPTTTLWDTDAKAIMPDKITTHRHVNVIYLTTPEGINIGKSIKILK